MTNKERVENWYLTLPDHVHGWNARDWSIAELVAERLDAEAAPEPQGCTVPPKGWYCTREKGHEGPCAAYPDP